MAAGRSSFSATVSFGLISIPTKGYITAKADDVHFNMMTPKGNRVKQKLVDAVTGEEVERANTQSGFEVAENQYVIFNDAEMEALAGDKSNVIEICEVVGGVGLSHTQIEKSFYLSPDKNADKAYKLLVKTLAASKKIAVCKWHKRGKDHLVALCPYGDFLLMFQLYYVPECREFSVNFQKGSDPSDREIELAGRLLEQLSSNKLDLSNYKDEYINKVRSAIEKKKNGEVITAANVANENSALDLSALLEGSLAK